MQVRTHLRTENHSSLLEVRLLMYNYGLDVAQGGKADKEGLISGDQIISINNISSVDYDAK